MALDPQTDDRTLVEAAQAGHREAFDLIVERHRRTVYAVCYRVLGNHEDASDATQNVFLRAYRGLPAFKGQSALTTWLYRIAVNASLNLSETRRPATDAVDPERYPDNGQTRADTRMLREEQARRVRAAVGRLPRKQRATLILRVYHDLSHDEISRILGSSVGAVKANFFHALRNLKGLLTDGGQR